MRHLLLLLLIIASASVLTGAALLKIQHRSGANVFLAAGLLLEVVCASLFVLRSLRRR